jgi:branched-chain amino acid transport system ATP-binding protein
MMGAPSVVSGRPAAIVTPLLTLQGLTKTFGGLTAVDAVSFVVEEGSVVGLIGPNGAGKTTVFNLITGNYRPDQGRIEFAGTSLAGLRTHRIIALGIARTFQNIRLFQRLTVLENVLAGCHYQMRGGILAAMLRLPSQRREENDAMGRALKELEFVGLRQQALTLAKNLAYGDQRRLEIARALATRPRLLVLDEPAGGMNEQETEALIGLIARIRERGITILLIEHDMRLVMRACEKLVVLENGGKIAEGSPEQVRRDPKGDRSLSGHRGRGVTRTREGALTMTATAFKFATYEDLFDLPENLVGEIIHGQLITQPRPAPKHALSPVLPSATNWSVPSIKGARRSRWLVDPVRAGVASWDRISWCPIWPAGGGSGCRSCRTRPTLRLPPDWVCEVLSPGTARIDRADKMPIYAEYGVSFLWLIDPALHTLEAFVLRDGHWSLEHVYQENDEVRAVPFDAVAFSLAGLWS